ncbi:MAG: cation diffusion facilitator family transporter [Oceanospirillaceae bacterium]|jgi:ferrous-iron efflux pump FieF|nr:cation diffusion facilitator family transporter [Oceanospirillaceae bacterium]MBT5630883.1 cation diffusion facilitator family transporter [Oceanospirillaceae bacterium]MBT6101541.1 cation diffusion facilitator family transporter [Oceanospirillaceae bacterium]MBT7674762.1 cation diffusion facilitator family transporter [Oceanospirillaceae bacterium]MDC1351392.1 cation diffusion facilitator family transporter [Oceanospirillaceae bacterium]
MTYSQLIKLATWASVVAAISLIGVKTWGWDQTQSVSLLASLIDSTMDSAASLINFFAIRYAMAPADKEHRFGHGKAEALAGLAQALMILVSIGLLLTQTLGRLWHPLVVENTPMGISIMLVSMALTGALVVFQWYVVKRTQSNAIKADSLHYTSDFLMNFGVIIALLLASIGYHGADPYFALSIGAFVVYSAWGIAQSAFHLLLDHELSDEQRHLITQLALTQPQVIGMHDLRSRQSGHMQFIQLHLELQENMLLLEAHDVAEALEHRIMAVFPYADVIIHLDPVSVAD